MTYFLLRRALGSRFQRLPCSPASLSRIEGLLLRHVVRADVLTAAARVVCPAVRPEKPHRPRDVLARAGVLEARAEDGASHRRECAGLTLVHRTRVPVVD